MVASRHKCVRTLRRVTCDASARFGTGTFGGISVFMDSRVRTPMMNVNSSTRVPCSDRLSQAGLPYFYIRVIPFSYHLPGKGGGAIPLSSCYPDSIEVRYPSLIHHSLPSHGHRPTFTRIGWYSIRLGRGKLRTIHRDIHSLNYLCYTDALVWCERPNQCCGYGDNC